MWRKIDISNSIPDEAIALGFSLVQLRGLRLTSAKLRGLTRLRLTRPSPVSA